MELLSRAQRHTSISSISRTVSPSLGINLKKKQYIRLESTTKPPSHFIPLKQLKQLKKVNRRNQKKQLLMALWEIKHAWACISDYLPIRDITTLSCLNKKMRGLSQQVLRDVIARMSESRWSARKQLLCYLGPSLSEEQKLLRSIPCKIESQIYLNTKSIPQVNSESIEVVYELTKCLRLKYSHFSYNSNLPLIIYNVVLLVGDKRAWDTIRMMVDRTQFPRIYNPSCESAIISIISREFQALARLRCMGSVSPSVFYSTIVKKLFIGTSSRLWGQFILLFVSRGWEVAGRLIYHLLSELALKGTSQDWITQEFFLHLSRQPTLEERQFVRKIKRAIEPDANQDKTRVLNENYPQNQVKVCPNKGFRVFSKHIK